MIGLDRYRTMLSPDPNLKIRKVVRFIAIYELMRWCPNSAMVARRMGLLTSSRALVIQSLDRINLPGWKSESSRGMFVRCLLHPRSRDSISRLRCWLDLFLTYIRNKSSPLETSLSEQGGWEHRRLIFIFNLFRYSSAPGMDARRMDSDQ